MHIKTLITVGAGSVSEGCTDLPSSLEGVRMTAEGVLIIEEPGSAEPAVSCGVFLLAECRLAGRETLKVPSRSHL